MIKKSLIPFVKKETRYRKNIIVLLKKRAKTPQNRGCETVLWGFCHKNGDEKFLKANNYENGEKNSSNLVQYSIEMKACQTLPQKCEFIEEM